MGPSAMIEKHSSYLSEILCSRQLHILLAEHSHAFETRKVVCKPDIVVLLRNNRRPVDMGVTGIKEHLGSKYLLDILGIWDIHLNTELSLFPQ